MNMLEKLINFEDIKIMNTLNLIYFGIIDNILMMFWFIIFLTIMRIIKLWKQ